MNSARVSTRHPCPRCDRGKGDTALADYGDSGRCFRCGYWFRRTQCRNCDAPIVLLEADTGQNIAVDADTFQVGDAGSIDARHKCGTSSEQLERLPTLPTHTTAHAEPLDWSSLADSIWRCTLELRGTLGQRYLEHRGCALPPRDSDLRYSPGSHKYPPSLCALVTDIVTARPISLHFTRLAPDGRGKAGTERDKVLLGGHRKRGGCIRLWTDDCVTYGLALAEGIETALAAAHAFTPAWAAIDAGNLRAFPVLGGIESLVIFADHDDAGLDAAQECAQRWRDADEAAAHRHAHRRPYLRRNVRVLTPITAGHDTADEVAAA